MAEEPAEDLVAEICQLAKGSARPVLDKGVKDWLESEARAIRQSLDLGHKYLPPPRWPLNEQNADFPTACAVLGVLHDKECSWCVLFPEPKSGTVYHLAWELYRNEVEDLGPRYMRKVLDFVRTELHKRGVLPTGEDETPTTVPTKPADDRAEQGEVTGAGSEDPKDEEDETSQHEELDELQRIEKDIPPLDTDSAEWLDQSQAKGQDNVSLDSLKTERSRPVGRRNLDGTFGVDKAGRVWRKESSSSKKVWYYKPRLRRNQVSNDNPSDH